MMLIFLLILSVCVALLQINLKEQVIPNTTTHLYQLKFVTAHVVYFGKSKIQVKIYNHMWDF